MPAEGKLNINLAESITKLRSAIKEFRLRENIYKIVFRGKGLEFESYRMYGPDDDASFIDWKASTRAQKLLVKQYKEERDLRIIFLIDVGGNMVLGSADKLKCELSAEMVLAFSDLILKAGDRVGFLVFGKEIKKFLPPASGDKQMFLIRDILSQGAIYEGKTDFKEGLDFALNYFDETTSAVVIVSDFVNFSKEAEIKFNLLSTRFETISLIVRDSLDKTLPDINKEIILQDPGSNQQVIVNPQVAKKIYEKYVAEKEKELYSFFKKQEVDYLELMTDKDFAFPLANFLKERIKKSKFK